MGDQTELTIGFLVSGVCLVLHGPLGSIDLEIIGRDRLSLTIVNVNDNVNVLIFLNVNVLRFVNDY